MEPFNWKCPYCGHAQAVSDVTYDDTRFRISNPRSKYERIGGQVISVVCSNEDCRELTLSFSINKAGLDHLGNWKLTNNVLHSWALLPESSAKPQPDYIPPAIRDNYVEACRIRDLSPKASATLSRRCLQGVIRDFWKIKGHPNLWSEIEAIKDKVDPVTWQGIDAVRKVGKIGAHMEEDVNFIIDVEPEEAQLLIGLIETLFREWYVIRYEREQRMTDLTALGAVKQQEMDEAKKAAKEAKETAAAAAAAAAAEPAPAAKNKE
ncbi:MAG: DUF4145 domain-containing protein [Rhodospirillales bacterium]|nr:DUF4145 domain-containing protein [Rhodospirillales bacterium]